jgi:hypothetical protein
LKRSLRVVDFVIWIDACLRGFSHLGDLKQEFDKLIELFNDWHASKREEQQHQKNKRKKRKTVTFM